VPSALAVATNRLSELNTPSVTTSLWPDNAAKTSPVAASQTRAVLSRLTVSASLPSGLNIAL